MSIPSALTTALIAVLWALTTIALVIGVTPDQAQAQRTGPILQFGCKVAKVAAMDPITDDRHPHKHVFYGNNKSIDPDSTWSSLVNEPSTTCARSFATSAYWHPVTRDGTKVNPIRRLSVYYLGRGQQSKVRPIPDGLQLIANESNGKVDYRCGQQATVDSPPYGCRADEFRIRVHFPDCWDQKSLKPSTLVESETGDCPSSHPYRIPKIRMSIHYLNSDGTLKGPLRVSAGAGEWKNARYMHADVFDAPQQPAFNRMITRCVINIKDNEPTPDPCQPG